MRLIIDADPLVYGCGFAAEGEPEHHAFNLVKGQINKWKDYFQSDDISVHISGSQKDLLRKQAYSDYKENRSHMPKPEHYEAIREYLKDYWYAKVSREWEADDEVAMESFYCKRYSLWYNDEGDIELDQIAPSCVIITIDKDLNQVPGWHFTPGTTNKPKDYFYYVDHESALMWWAAQMLQGDSGDGIKGIPGCGPACARKNLLDWLDYPEDYNLLRFVSKIYTAHGLGELDYKKTFDLITMIQSGNQREEAEYSLRETINSKSGMAGQEVQDSAV